MHPLRKALFIASACLVLLSCRKPSSANWDVDVTLPLVNCVLDIKNFLADSIISTDNDGVLNVRMNRQVAALLLDSLLNLPDTTFPASFTSTIGLSFGFQPGDVIPFDPAELSFNVGNGTMLKRIDIRSGRIQVKFSNNLAEPVQLTYMLKEATRSGQPFVIREIVPPGNNTLSKEYDLAGYTFNLRGPKGTEYNKLVQTFSLALAPGANSVTIKYGDGANILVNYSNIIPQYVEGYFGKQEVKINPDTSSFDFISNLKASGFQLSDATMKFTIINDLGAEFSGGLYGIKAINTPDNRTVALSGNQLSNLNINRAVKKNGAVESSTYTVLFNKTNSNITSFISALPDKITYAGSVILDPLENISGFNDFAYYNTGIRVLADVTIPMRFRANYFELRNDAAINLESLNELSRLNSGNLVVTVNNGYPFDAKLQAYLIDASGFITDSLFVSGANVISRGQIDNNNVVIAPLRSSINIPVSQEKIRRIREAKSVRVFSRFDLPANTQDIPLLERYQLEINIVADVNAKVGTNG